MNEWLLLAAGGMLLYFGAEWFVGGASALALALRVPQIIVGLTIVAYGTSAPELVVSVRSALDGRGEIALANIVGSNIANVGLILGLTTLLRPPAVEKSLSRRELPVLVASAVVVPLLLLDDRVGRADGAALLALAVGYTAWMARTARSDAVLRAARAETAATARAADDAGAPRTRSAVASAVTALVGLGVLLVGGQLFVKGAVRVAAALGVDDRVIGLTIVAVGTSLPELVTSLIAAKRGHSDLAVGNVIGSNIFNVLLCLGAAALAGPVGAPLDAVTADLGVLVLMSGLAAIFIRAERVITRFEGAAVLAIYVVYTVSLVAHA